MSKKPKTTPMVRHGQKLNVLEDGHPRRLSDFRNAWRKMTPAQRREALNWIDAEGLKVSK